MWRSGVAGLVLCCAFVAGIGLTEKPNRKELADGPSKLISTTEITPTSSRRPLDIFKDTLRGISRNARAPVKIPVFYTDDDSDESDSEEDYEDKGTPSTRRTSSSRRTSTTVLPSTTVTPSTRHTPSARRTSPTTIRQTTTFLPSTRATPSASSTTVSSAMTISRTFSPTIRNTGSPKTPLSISDALNPKSKPENQQNNNLGGSPRFKLDNRPFLQKVEEKINNLTTELSKPFLAGSATALGHSDVTSVRPKIFITPLNDFKPKVTPQDTIVTVLKPNFPVRSPQPLQVSDLNLPPVNSTDSFSSSVSSFISDVVHSSSSRSSSSFSSGSSVDNLKPNQVVGLIIIEREKEPTIPDSSKKIDSFVSDSLPSHPLLIQSQPATHAATPHPQNNVNLVVLKTPLQQTSSEPIISSSVQSSIPKFPSVISDNSPNTSPTFFVQERPSQASIPNKDRSIPSFAADSRNFQTAEDSVVVVDQSQSVRSQAAQSDGSVVLVAPGFTSGDSFSNFPSAEAQVGQFQLTRSQTGVLANSLRRGASTANIAQPHSVERTIAAIARGVTSEGSSGNLPSVEDAVALVDQIESARSHTGVLANSFRRDTATANTALPHSVERPLAVITPSFTSVGSSSNFPVDDAVAIVEQIQSPTGILANSFKRDGPTAQQHFEEKQVPVITTSFTSDGSSDNFSSVEDAVALVDQIESATSHTGVLANSFRRVAPTATAAQPHSVEGPIAVSFTSEGSPDNFRSVEDAVALVDQIESQTGVLAKSFGRAAPSSTIAQSNLVKKSVGDIVGVHQTSRDGSRTGNIAQPLPKADAIFFVPSGTSNTPLFQSKSPINLSSEDLSLDEDDSDEDVSIESLRSSGKIQTRSLPYNPPVYTQTSKPYWARESSPPAFNRADQRKTTHSRRAVFRSYRQIKNTSTSQDDATYRRRSQIPAGNPTVKENPMNSTASNTYFTHPNLPKSGVDASESSRFIKKATNFYFDGNKPGGNLLSLAAFPHSLPDGHSINYYESTPHRGYAVMFPYIPSTQTSLKNLPDASTIINTGGKTFDYNFWKSISSTNEYSSSHEKELQRTEINTKHGDHLTSLNSNISSNGFSSDREGSALPHNPKIQEQGSNKHHFESLGSRTRDETMRDESATSIFSKTHTTAHGKDSVTSVASTNYPAISAIGTKTVNGPLTFEATTSERSTISKSLVSPQAPSYNSYQAATTIDRTVNNERISSQKSYTNVADTAKVSVFQQSQPVSPQDSYNNHQPAFSIVQNENDTPIASDTISKNPNAKNIKGSVLDKPQLISSKVSNNNYQAASIGQIENDERIGFESTGKNQYVDVKNIQGSVLHKPELVSYKVSNNNYQAASIGQVDNAELKTSEMASKNPIVGVKISKNVPVFQQSQLAGYQGSYKNYQAASTIGKIENVERIASEITSRNSDASVKISEHVPVVQKPDLVNIQDPDNNYEAASTIGRAVNVKRVTSDISYTDAGSDRKTFGVLHQTAVGTLGSYKNFETPSSFDVRTEKEIGRGDKIKSDGTSEINITYDTKSSGSQSTSDTQLLYETSSSIGERTDIRSDHLTSDTNGKKSYDRKSPGLPSKSTYDTQGLYVNPESSSTIGTRTDIKIGHDDHITSHLSSKVDVTNNRNSYGSLYKTTVDTLGLYQNSEASSKTGTKSDIKNGDDVHISSGLRSKVNGTYNRNSYGALYKSAVETQGLYKNSEIFSTNSARNDAKSSRDSVSDKSLLYSTIPVHERQRTHTHNLSEYNISHSTKTEKVSNTSVSEVSEISLIMNSKVLNRGHDERHSAGGQFTNLVEPLPLSVSEQSSTNSVIHHQKFVNTTKLLSTVSHHTQVTHHLFTSASKVMQNDRSRSLTSYASKYRPTAGFVQVPKHPVEENGFKRYANSYIPASSLRTSGKKTETEKQMPRYANAFASVPKSSKQFDTKHFSSENRYADFHSYHRKSSLTRPTKRNNLRNNRNQNVSHLNLSSKTNSQIVTDYHTVLSQGKYRYADDFVPKMPSDTSGLVPGPENKRNASSYARLEPETTTKNTEEISRNENRYANAFVPSNKPSSRFSGLLPHTGRPTSEKYGRYASEYIPSSSLLPETPPQIISDSHPVLHSPLFLAKEAYQRHGSSLKPSSTLLPRDDMAHSSTNSFQVTRSRQSSIYGETQIHSSSSMAKDSETFKHELTQVPIPHTTHTSDSHPKTPPKPNPHSPAPLMSSTVLEPSKTSINSMGISLKNVNIPSSEANPYKSPTPTVRKLTANKPQINQLSTNIYSTVNSSSILSSFSELNISSSSQNKVSTQRVISTLSPRGYFKVNEPLVHVLRKRRQVPMSSQINFNDRTATSDFNSESQFYSGEISGLDSSKGGNATKGPFQNISYNSSSVRNSYLKSFAPFFNRVTGEKGGLILPAHIEVIGRAHLYAPAFLHKSLLQDGIENSLAAKVYPMKENQGLNSLPSKTTDTLKNLQSSAGLIRNRKPTADEKPLFESSSSQFSEANYKNKPVEPLPLSELRPLTPVSKTNGFVREKKVVAAMKGMATKFKLTTIVTPDDDCINS